jgi:hypothetical protein
LCTSILTAGSSWKKRLERDIQPGQHAVGLDQEHTARPLLARDDRFGRDVAAAQVSSSARRHDLTIDDWARAAAPSRAAPAAGVLGVPYSRTMISRGSPTAVLERAHAQRGPQIGLDDRHEGQRALVGLDRARW